MQKNIQVPISVLYIFEIKIMYMMLYEVKRRLDQNYQSSEINLTCKAYTAHTKIWCGTWVKKMILKLNSIICYKKYWHFTFLNVYKVVTIFSVLLGT